MTVAVVSLLAQLAMQLITGGVGVHTASTGALDPWEKEVSWAWG